MFAGISIVVGAAILIALLVLVLGMLTGVSDFPIEFYEAFEFFGGTLSFWNIFFPVVELFSVIKFVFTIVVALFLARLYKYVIGLVRGV